MFINKENFKQEDVNEYEKLKIQINTHPTNYIRVEYLDEEVKHIELPTILFSYLIDNNLHSKYRSLLPYNVKIKKLNKEGYWLQYTNYMGLQDENELTLYLAHDIEHPTLSLLWILLHEFRHKIQFNNKVIFSNVFNNNYEMLLKYINKPLDKTLDVFHEILPYEIDANIFACEILNIEYPGSKFEITEETLKMLENETNS